MYEGGKMSVRTFGGGKNECAVDIGLHQGLALSHFLFACVMDDKNERMIQKCCTTKGYR